MKNSFILFVCPNAHFFALLLPRTKWANSPSTPMTFFNVTGVTHFDLLSNADVLGHLRAVIEDL